MSHRDIILYWAVLAFEIALCTLVFARKLQRRLPFFAGYATVLLGCTVGLGFTYRYFGFRSVTSFYAYWVTAGLDLVARSLAIVELCRYRLRMYQGIWALVWRVLVALSLFFLLHAALDAWGQANRLVIYGLTIERDVDVSSIVILIVLLMIRNYYGLALEPLQRLIAVGICLFCFVDVINNTTLRDLFAGALFSWFMPTSTWPSWRSQIERVSDLWNTARFSSFMISMSIWCYALRKPLPDPVEAPVMLPAETYGELSPAINLRLRTFNDRLAEMLKS